MFKYIFLAVIIAVVIDMNSVDGNSQSVVKQFSLTFSTNNLSIYWIGFRRRWKNQNQNSKPSNVNYIVVKESSPSCKTGNCKSSSSHSGREDRGKGDHDKEDHYKGDHGKDDRGKGDHGKGDGCRGCRGTDGCRGKH